MAKKAKITVTQKIAPYEGDWVPGEYVVWQHVSTGQFRIGGYRTVEEARKAIKTSEASRHETFGGLLAPNKSKVTYSIWHCAKWERIKED